MAKIVMGARKKELGAWRENGREDSERKCSHNAVKSASSTRERAAVPSEANKARGRLEKRPYPRVLCGSKPRSHPQTLST